MEVSRQVHDEVLVRLEEPRQMHLQEEVDQVMGCAPVSPAAAKSYASEMTPLVLKAGDATVSMGGAQVDLGALDRKLQAEEQEALREDRATPTLTIAKEEATSLVKISLPLTASSLLATVSGIVMSMLLGNVSGELSTIVIAASTLSESTAGLVSGTINSGIAMAGDTMCAQAFGAKQYKEYWLFAQASFLAMVYIFPIITLIVANGTSILVFLGQDPALASLASLFMRISLLALPFSITLLVMGNALVAQGIALPMTVVSIIGQVVGLPLAYVLGYKTSLGYIGIPVAQLVSSIIQTAYLGHVVMKNPFFIESWPGWQLKEAHRLVKKLWPLGISTIVMLALQNFSINIVSMICGLLPNGVMAISSSTIGMSYVNIAFMPIMGFFSGAIVRVATALGGSQPRRAMIATKVTLATMLSIAAVASIISATYADSFTHTFTTDKETAEAATKLVYVLLPMIPLIACVLTAQAVLTACAKQLLSAQLNFVALVVIGLPVGCLLGFQLSWGAAGLWSGQILGLALFSVAAGAWIIRQDWTQLSHTARMNAHLHVEKVPDEPSPEPRSAHVV